MSQTLKKSYFYRWQQEKFSCIRSLFSLITENFSLVFFPRIKRFGKKSLWEECHFLALGCEVAKTVCVDFLLFSAQSSAISHGRTIIFNVLQSPHLKLKEKHNEKIPCLGLFTEFYDD